ncbi:AAA domain-containing protein [Campylobacter jejuni]|nr:AAA domain-containing protein [Campylobacter jejuni]
MTKIFSENDKKEIQDIFKKMIDLAMKFYNDRNSTFKDDIEDIQNFFESYEWKLYTGLQTLQKDEYKGFALYKEIEEEEYIKFKKGRSAWHGIYIWFGVSRDDIYMRIVTKEEEKCNALLKIQKDNILDYKLEEKIDKFEEIKDRLFDVFLYLSNYINNLSKDDFKIIKDYNMMKNNTPLNQILYGPPGTGKTYHTIDKALEILGENLESRDEKKAKFDEYVKNGQIVFTTFHQSYGYEEFIEGIKPDLDKQNENENSQIRYKIKDGIFKKLYKKALYKEQKSKNDTLISNYSSVWKISLGYNASLREECFKENKICIGWNEIPKNMGDEFLKLGNNDKNTINSFKNEMQLGDLVCVFNSLKTIKGIGIIKSDVKYTQQGEYQTYREVEWISKDDEVNIYELNDNINLTQKTVYKLWRISPNILLDKISNVKNLELIQDNTKEPFIIIIDEINRGNVSKIFGELITLIEPSKRIGEKEELKVTLPYSGEKFGVPKNVYIIGTMNTADRSITSLDTALRRRFEFVEMMPDVSKLSMDCKGINLQELLKAINTRIEYLLDREKTIGHAFFIGVENLNDLKSIFQNKIIPLLQEYFYNDYALINAVLNDNGMIFKDKKDDKYLQKIKNLDSVNSERSIYNIASFDDKIWDKIEIYQAIYNDEIANKLKNENE